MELIFEKCGCGIQYPNKYYLYDKDTIMIEVTNSKNDVVYSYIDKEDFEKVKICNWKIRYDSQTIYLANSQYGFIHRLIMNCPPELTIDHIDRNGLNNRKSNLRKVSQQINNLNHENLQLMYWYEPEQRYRIWYKKDKKRTSKSFSVSKFGTKEKAHEAAQAFKEYLLKEVYKII